MKSQVKSWARSELVSNILAVVSGTDVMSDRYSVYLKLHVILGALYPCLIVDQL
jgi:hypothetical protein